MRKKQIRILVKVCVLLVIFLALFISFWGAYSRKKQFINHYKAEATVAVSGFVYHKEIKANKYVYYLKNVYIDDSKYRLRGVRILLRTEKELPIYTWVSYAGKIKIFDRARNEGEFDARGYYEGLGLLCEVQGIDTNDYAIESKNILEKCVSSIGEMLYAFSEKINSVYEYALFGEESGVMSAIALGKRGGIEAEVKGILSAAGIIHIIAVSGLHIAVVGRGIYKLLRRLGGSFLIAGLIAFIMVILYGQMCGMSVSCVRAIGMFLIYIISQILGRKYDMGRAAICMAIFILIDNPFAIFSSSFVFSFGAVAGIVLVATPLSNAVVEKIEEMRRGMTKDICKHIVPHLISTIGISLFTMPIVAYFYYEIPVYSVLLNLIVLPVIGILLAIGLIGGVLCASVIPVSGFWKLIFLPCHIIIYYIELIADKSVLLPGSKFICGKPEWWSILIYDLVLIFVVRITKVYISKISRVYTFSSGIKCNKRFLENDTIKMIFIDSSLMFFCVSLLLFSRTLAADYRISFIDVGQGDGIYLSDGRNCNVMIDGGSTSNKQLGKYTILPFLKYNGVRSVDYWFVSHCDEDHVSGLIYALEQGYKIKGVYLSQNVLKDKNYDKLVFACRRAGVGIRYMVVGDKLVTDKFTLTCVLPSADAAKQLGSDANARSMVLRIDDKYGHKGLFVGDINDKAENILINDDRTCAVDFIKVAHHGSKYSSTERFLNEIKPRVAIISCGRNTYGHPHKSTLERLENVGASIYKTIDLGQIDICGKSFDVRQAVP